ncbi:MAG: hypothetical protein AAFX50_17275, partial [Acidobacteriota bacterium]
MSKKYLIWLAAAAVAAAPISAEERADGDAAPHTPPTVNASNDADDDATDEETLHVYEEVEVRERFDDLLGLATSAAEGSVGRLDLA